MEKLRILDPCASNSPRAIFQFCRNIQNGMNQAWGAFKRKGSGCVGMGVVVATKRERAREKGRQ